MAESKGSQGAKGKGEPTTSGTAAATRRTGWSRWRPYSAAIVGVAVVFAGSAAIGAHVRAGAATQIKVPAGVPSTGPAQLQLAVPVKPAIPVSVTVYEDLRSPQSRAFALQWRQTLDDLLNSGQAEIDYRLVTQTDATQGGTGSAEAANAAACAQDQGKNAFVAFVDELWKHQPPVSDDHFANQAYLDKLARKAGGIQASLFVPCVQSRDHAGWVSASQQDYVKAGLGDVPVVQVNGVTLDPAGGRLTPAMLRRAVAKAVAHAVAYPSASPSPSAS